MSIEFDDVFKALQSVQQETIVPAYAGPAVNDQGLRMSKDLLLQELQEKRKEAEMAIRKKGGKVKKMDRTKGFLDKLEGEEKKRKNLAKAKAGIKPKKK